MPRQARKKSQNNIYHIMFRGINRQQIFEDAEDNAMFLEVVNEYKSVCNYKLFAWCIMGNHVHLLMRFDGEPMQLAFKRICGKFVYWYNAKYRRFGHLFQDRFKSEPIQDDNYLIACVRYIHQNPVKAKISTLQDYLYSSFSEYMSDESPVYTDVEYVLSMMTKSQLKQLCEQPCNQTFVDFDDKVTAISDEQAKAIIFKISGCANASDFQRLSSQQKQQYFALLKQNNLSIRQISRLTGESYYLIQKA